MNKRRVGQRSRGRRRGFVFSLRLTEAELADLRARKPPSVPIGTWIRALVAVGSAEPRNVSSGPLFERAVRRRGSTGSSATWSGSTELEDAGVGITRARNELTCSMNGCGDRTKLEYIAVEGSSFVRSGPYRTGPPKGEVCNDCLAQGMAESGLRDKRRIVLDLCSGSGAWSEPYLRAGYDVRRITLPETDVRGYVPPTGVWGVLAAPPCEAFSLARNGRPPSQDELTCGLGIVAACLRVIALCRPRWWALENPIGRLGHCLGTPTYTFQPWWFGDPWTKRTALWGRFALPSSGPDTYIEPHGSAANRSKRSERARTPPGFARAFFEANP